MTRGAAHVDDGQGRNELASASGDFPAVRTIAKIYVCDQAVKGVLVGLQGRKGFIPVIGYLEFKPALAKRLFENVGHRFVIFHEEKQRSGVQFDLSPPTFHPTSGRETQRWRNSSHEPFVSSRGAR